MNTNSEKLSPAKAARILRVTDGSIYNWLKENPQLAERDDRGNWRIDRQQLLAFVEARIEPLEAARKALSGSHNAIA